MTPYCDTLIRYLAVIQPWCATLVYDLTTSERPDATTAFCRRCIEIICEVRAVFCNQADDPGLLKAPYSYQTLIVKMCGEKIKEDNSAFQLEHVFFFVIFLRACTTTTTARASTASRLRGT